MNVCLGQNVDLNLRATGVGQGSSVGFWRVRGGVLLLPLAWARILLSINFHVCFCRVVLIVMAVQNLQFSVRKMSFISLLVLFLLGRGIGQNWEEVSPFSHSPHPWGPHLPCLPADQLPPQPSLPPSPSALDASTLHAPHSSWNWSPRLSVLPLTILLSVGLRPLAASIGHGTWSLVPHPSQGAASCVLRQFC